MYDTDFQAQWGEDEDPEAYSIPITTDPETFTELEPVGGDQLPGTYPLAVMRSALASWSMRSPGLCGLFPLLSGTLRRRERGGEHWRHLLRLLYSAGRPVKPCQTQNFASPPEAAPSRRPLFCAACLATSFLTRGPGCDTIPGKGKYCARRRVGVALEPYPQAIWRYGAPVLFCCLGQSF